LENKDYIKGLLIHDHKVLESIYSDFSGRIQHHIQQKGGTADDAKDIFHDALIVIYQKAQSPDFKLTSQFYTYLYGICHFMWDRKRNKKANNTVTIPEDDRLILQEDIVADIESREKQRVFRENIVKLGETCRKILRLFFDKKSMTEIAAALNFENEHIARTRKYRCGKKLETLIKADSRYAELKNQKVINRKSVSK
jgi:RNA polymerase sigma factor (sigma-70 family)